MRVVLLTDWFLPRLGGMEVHIGELARDLDARGHEVHVVTSTPADADLQGRLQAGSLELPDRVRIRRLDLPVLPGVGLMISPLAVLEAGDALSAIRPDVVHVHTGMVPPFALSGTLAAHRAGLPTVSTYHSVLGPMRHLWWASDQVVGWSGWSTLLTGVSDLVAREMRDVVPDRSVSVLPNGVRPEAWRIDERTPRPDDELRLVSVMRLQKRKRGAALLRAVASANERLAGSPDSDGVPSAGRVTLTVIGDGPLRHALEHEARRLGLDDRVDFAGYLGRPALRERFARSDAFLLLSVRESFGLAALEARAAGLPVVARGDSGIATFITRGKDGLLAETDRGVTDHVVRLAREPELLDRLTAHCRETPPPHEWGEVGALHVETYEAAIAASRGR